MTTIDVEGTTVQTRLIHWRWVRGGWQSGNVRIVEGPPRGRIGSYLFHAWYVRIKVNGQWRWAWPKTRRYPWGSANQAKVGLSKWKHVVTQKHKPW